MLDERQIRHAAAGRLLARGVGESRAEHIDGRDAAPLDLDRVGDVDRGRGAAIAEAKHHRVALRESAKVGFAQAVLRRELAYDRTGHHAIAVAELAAQPLDEEIGVALAVVDKADAFAAHIGETPRAGEQRRIVGNGRFEQFEGHRRDFLPHKAWILLDPN